MNMISLLSSSGDIVDQDNDDMDSYEPLLSSELKVTYITMDRACQTERSDIVDVKNLSETLYTTTNEINRLKQDLVHVKKTLQARYEGTLKEELDSLKYRVIKAIVPPSWLKLVIANEKLMIAFSNTIYSKKFQNFNIYNRLY